MIKKLVSLLLVFMSLSCGSFAQTNTGTMPEMATAEKLYNAEKYSQALYWYKKAAAKGDVGAMEMLVEMYIEGIGTPVNAKVSQQWQDKIDKAAAKAEKAEVEKEKKANSKKRSSAKDEDKDDDKLPYNKDGGEEPD